MQLKAENISLIRKGCNSQIFLLKEQDLQVAIKAVSDQCFKQTKHVLNQWTILSKVVHENVIEVYRMGKDVSLPGKPGKYNLLAQEYAQHGNLLDFIKNNKFSITQRRLVFSEVASALHHLHGNSIVHRDIKLDNILIMNHENGVTAKIADFGFASILKQEPDHLLNTYKGTRRGYMAPEIHNCKQDSSKYYDGKAADIFALGVVLFALVLGRLPFQFGLSTDKYYGLLAQEKFSQFWSYHTAPFQKLSLQQHSLMDEFRDLFQNLVSIEPQTRLTTQEILSHPWLNGIKERPQP